MLYEVKIEGTTGLIMHNGAAGLDTRSPENLEKAQIAKKRGSNRTLADDERLAELETLTSLWLNLDGKPTIPAAALRSCIETAARRLKQGPQVREGLVVREVKEFAYDQQRYGKTVKTLAKRAQYTVPVVVQRNRILRTRALFELPWACTFVVEGDPELVDDIQLRTWLDIAGRRIGLGDWRPEKSGQHGRFHTVSIETLPGPAVQPDGE